MLKLYYFWIHAMVQEVLEIIRYFNLAYLALVLFFLIIESKYSQKVIFSILFCASVFVYFAFEKYKGMSTTANLILVFSRFLITYFFWLFSMSVFRKKFTYTRWHFMGVIILIPVYIIFDQINPLHISFSNEYIAVITHLIPQIIQIVFISSAYYISKNAQDFDKSTTKVRFKKTFFYLASGLFLLNTLISTSISFFKTPAEIMLLHHLVILVLLFLFFGYRLKMIPGFFFSGEKVTIQLDDEDVIIQKIEDSMTNQKIYLREGITIKGLSEHIQEHEYKVRKAINYAMGFKNFNDYLNSKRIADAIKILENPDKNKLTILEIAYSLGYQSISPFYKAFKEITGITPTEYRSKKQNI